MPLENSSLKKWLKMKTVSKKSVSLEKVSEPLLMVVSKSLDKQAESSIENTMERKAYFIYLFLD
jgi:hypothetical protein